MTDGGDGTGGAAAVQVKLDEVERELLVAGLLDWDGPARSHDRIATLFGFSSDIERRHNFDLMVDPLLAGRAMTPLQWTRALLSAELIFASDVLGTGRGWSAIHGHDRAQWWDALRRLQSKIPHDRRLLGL